MVSPCFWAFCHEGSMERACKKLKIRWQGVTRHKRESLEELALMIAAQVVPSPLGVQQKSSKAYRIVVPTARNELFEKLFEAIREPVASGTVRPRFPPDLRNQPCAEFEG